MTANQIKIPMSFKNYKLLKDNSFELSGSYIYFILGSNKKGKTSIKNSIASMRSSW
jgi:ABC-type branched-subunit amino acid transport system ATPase component